MSKKPIVCPLCGQEHERTMLNTHASHIVFACTRCEGKITLHPRRLGRWRWTWPKVVGKARVEK